jgi:hypothetical protein
MYNDVMELLDDQCESAWGSMVNEISTDENADYRRGFRAGRLVAALELKADVLTKITTQESEEK